MIMNKQLELATSCNERCGGVINSSGVQTVLLETELRHTTNKWGACEPRQWMVSC